MTFLARLFGRAAVPSRPMAWIEPPDLAARLGGANAPLVLDVRGPDEFAGPLGHVPEALNIPLPDLRRRMGEVTGASRGVVTVCLTDRRSAAAAAQLRAAGLSDVAVLRGGMRAWRALALPTG